jgi:hypothetical protein
MKEIEAFFKSLDDLYDPEKDKKYPSASATMERKGL